MGTAPARMKNLTDVIKAIEKAMSGLGSLIFLFFILSQFVCLLQLHEHGDASWP